MALLDELFHILYYYFVFSNPRLMEKACSSIPIGLRSFFCYNFMDADKRKNTIDGAYEFDRTYLERMDKKSTPYLERTLCFIPLTNY